MGSEGCRLTAVEAVMAVLVFCAMNGANGCRYVVIGADVTVEDSGNYTCEIRGHKSTVLSQITHSLFVRCQFTFLLTYLFIKHSWITPNASSTELSTASLLRSAD